jgi:hypothetical protein
VWTEGTTGADVINLRDYILREGDSVGCETTGNGGDSSRGMTIGYSKISLEE